MLNNFPLWPQQASTIAGNVDALYIFLLIVTGMMALLVFSLVIFFAARFRHRPGVRAEQVEGSTPLEVVWSTIPFLIFMVIFGWGAVVFFKERTPPADATEVYVVAKQWMWKLEHAEGQREINELHVPVGRDVKLIMTSQDVIHSFYIPAFRIKQDVLPGRYTVEWFKATKPGVYHLFCAEYCGTQHSGMVGSIVVQQPADYEAWMAGASTGPLSVSGEKIFAELGCSSCHRSDMQGRGPNLQGVFGNPVQLEDGRTMIADENYLRQCILDPGSKRLKGFQPIMPTFQGLVDEEQVNALVAYIKAMSISKPMDGAKTSASSAMAGEVEINDTARQSAGQSAGPSQTLPQGSKVQ